MFFPIKYETGKITLIDQTKLPIENVALTCTTVEQLWDAIKRLSVRGAPLLGVTAAYGICLGLDTHTIESVADCQNKVEELGSYITSSRPTAVNLFWAVERMVGVATAYAGDDLAELVELLKTEAETIFSEDISLSKAIGEHGNSIINDGDGILTHCNAGGLATSGYGTACAVFFSAHDAGKHIHVYADETRPLLQGARLTAWEMQEYGIPVTVQCDNMAAVLMREGKIQKVITGADRIAANGDAANKIGTYGVAILAKHHNIPFYIAAPYSTFDFSLATGAEIEIEQRDRAEVACGMGKQTVPDDVDVFNPAFDVTPHALITGIITEKGIITPPYVENLKQLR